jgi:D-glycero-alpha-D-manno-heptose 1-phosphate guanylyltransferase
MEAVILAGGLGTRLRKTVPDLPKPLAPICGKPFLEILLKNLSEKGLTRAILSLGFMSEKIVNHFGSSFSGIKLEYVVEDTPLGTGGATRLALAKCEEDHAYVMNGDTFVDLEISEIEKLWQLQKKPIIVARHVADTNRYGRLLISDGILKGFTEKGISGSGLINAGCYVFARDQLRDINISEAFSLEADYLTNSFIKKEDIFCFETKGVFIDIGIPEDFARAQTLLVSY